MIGSNERSWSWLYSVILPALVAIIEASWMSIWVSAIANSGHPARFDLPFFAFVLPAAGAAVLASLIGRLGWSTWPHRALTISVILAGAAITAGAIGALCLHGPFIATIAASATNAGLAWFIGSISWLRGNWLGRNELSLRHTSTSMVIAVIAYVIFFAWAAMDHNPSFHHEVTPAAVLLLVLFPAAVGGTVLVNEREFEQLALRSRRSRPSLAWLAAVALPMVAVAIVALIIAVAIGPAAPYVGRIIGDGAHDFVTAATAVANWIGDLFHHVHAKKHPEKLSSSSGAPQNINKIAKQLPSWIGVVADVTLVLLAIAIIYFLGPIVLRMRFRRHRRARAGTGLHEERESLFSWGHLLDQLRHWWRGLRHHEEPTTADALGLVGIDRELPVGGTIRHHYRRVLITARRVGVGRATSETPTELSVRLAPLTEPPADVALTELTVAYERARYGGEPGSADEIDQALRDAELLISALTPPAGE